MELWLSDGKTNTNILPLVGELSWAENVDTLGVQLDFNINYSDAKYFPKIDIEPGYQVSRVDGGNNLFEGVIITEGLNGRDPRSYTSMDYAFYLNKNEDIYQFNGIRSDEAIKRILRDYGISFNIAPIATTIKQIYLDKTLSFMINDILAQSTKQTGVKYNLEMVGRTLSIQPHKVMELEGVYTLISNPSRSRSIADMKNSIKLYTGNEDHNRIVTVAKNRELINRYGLLQQVESVDEKDIAQAKQIATQLLKELGKIPEDNSLTLMGDKRIKAGRVITIEEPITGMTGKYLIRDCKHTYGQQYTVDIGIERWSS